MTKALTVLLEDIIENLMRNVEDDDQREMIYNDMIQPLEAAGFEDFTEVLGFDSIFDKVYVEHYPELVGRED